MKRLWIPVDLKQDKISTRVAVCQQANAVQINKSHYKLNSSPKNVSKKILRNNAQCLQSFRHKILHLKTNSDVDNHNLADLTPHLQCCPTVLQLWVCNYSLETALWQTEMSTRDLMWGRQKDIWQLIRLASGRQPSRGDRSNLFQK